MKITVFNSRKTYELTHQLKTLLVLPAIGLLMAGVVHAQTWPAKPVRIVVPFSAGGPSDLVARAVAQALATNLGQPFVVDNKSGATGGIAAVEVARASPDGYTLLAGTSSTHSVAPALSTQLRYKPVEDFTPVALLATANNVILLSPTIDVRNMRELFAFARAKPGFLNYSSSGIGSFPHLTLELLQNQAGVSFTHVPYKGTSSSITDLVSGSIHLAVDTTSTALPFVKDGRLRALAVTGSRRSPLLPDVPTVAESGLAGYSVSSWFGLYGPRAMPPQLAQRINDEVNKVLRSPEMAARFTTLGIEPGKGTPDEFANMVAADTVRWTKAVKDLKLKVD